MRQRSSVLAPLLLALSGPALFPAAPPGEPAVAGERVDLASFGTPISGEGFLGLEWENPRDVREVTVVLPQGTPSPPAEGLRLEWWGSVWPANGRGGWMRLDDPWNGEWVKAAARRSSGAQGELTFSFPPLKKEEWKEAAGPEVDFRRTLKLRVAGEAPFPPGTRLRVLGASVWRETSFDLELRFFEDGGRAGRIDLRNGALLGLESLPAP